MKKNSLNYLAVTDIFILLRHGGGLSEVQYDHGIPPTYLSLKLINLFINNLKL